MEELNWKTILSEEFKSPYYSAILSTLKEEKEKGIQIFPPQDLVFNAYSLTPFSKIKVVILGQDPYHNSGQAHGLSFSVPQGVKLPPSLKNIFQELRDDCAIDLPTQGNLSCWASQGVFLLNSILTVRAHEPASHQQLGWQQLTDATISAISDRLSHIVFMLWGNFAQQKESLIDSSKHLILKAPHPSPFSVYRGFYGCKHFSKANEYLALYQRGVIDWSVR